jgi:hypothetical protein
MRTSLGCGALAVIGVLAGCNTTTKTGAVGDTLSGSGVSVTLLRVDGQPHIPRPDIGGLSTPASGDRLLGAKVRVCSNQGGAIGTFDFAVDVDGGGSGRVKYPQGNYANGFDAVRTGCAAGWLVFEFPSYSTPTKIRFAYDNTGSNEPGDQQQESHERFSWSLS